LHTETKSGNQIQQIWRNRPIGKRIGPPAVLLFNKRTGRQEKFRAERMRILLASIWFAASLVSFQPRQACGAEPSVEAAPQNTSVTTASKTGGDLSSPLPFQLTLATYAGYDDNVATSSGGGGSSFTNDKVTLSYNFDNTRTQLTMLSVGGIKYYLDGRTDVDTNLDMSLIHNVSVRLKLAATVYVAYRTEPDFSSNAGPETRQGNYLQTLDTFAATYHWLLRFSTVTSFKFHRVQYENSSVGSSQDRSEETFGEEFRFSLSTRTTLAGEYRFEIVDYDNFPRDSTTHFALIGFDEDFTSALKVVTRGGVTFRSFTNDGDRTDPYFEGFLDYAFAERSSLNWKTTYSVEEPSSTQALSRTTFRTGVNLRYGLTARISLDASGYYHHDENQGTTTGKGSSGFSSDSVDLSVDAKYTINRRFSFSLNYERSQVISSMAGQGDYSRNLYSAGLIFTY
jgi:Putative beta-barrel porin 2